MLCCCKRALSFPYNKYCRSLRISIEAYMKNEVFIDLLGGFEKQGTHYFRHRNGHVLQNVSRIYFFIINRECIQSNL